MRLAQLVFAAMAMFAAAACQVVAQIDDRDEALFCEHASLPSKPVIASGKNGDVGAVVFALDLSISINRDDDSGVVHGFDLDGVCSSPSTAKESSCKRCQDADEDDPHGRDNGVAKALANPFFFTLLNETKAAVKKIDRFHLLVEVLSWNGEANDPDVVVRFYRSHGGENNVWSTTEDSYVSEVAPVMVAKEAWVRDGRVVAKADTLDFDFAGTGFGGRGSSSDTDRLPIHLDEAVLMLPIKGTTTTAGAREIHDGIIAGRWSTKSALAALSHVNTAESGAAAPRWLCGSDDGYATLKRALCVNADIPTHSSNDKKGDRCDAISIVFDVTGKEGQRSTTERLTLPSQSGCNLDGHDWKDDCTSAWEIQNCTFAN
jgi:hypothetical protein